ncbi:MAG: GNAT family N-acetyltransferase [Actinomycetota bacterium]|nr:GNAT family N-acetyltransferase [Actinomycetota bacterium]
MDVELRTLSGDGEVEQAWHLLCRSFGWSEADLDRFRDDLDPERTRVAVVDGEVVAFSRIRPFGQFFGGRAVPLAGYSAVGVAPEHRGRGLGSQVTAAHFEELRRRGEWIAGLFPASTGLYRALGFELAGVWGRRTVPTRTLRTLPAPTGVLVRRATRSDIAAMKACYRRVASQIDGWLDRSEAWWRRILEKPFDERQVYVVDGDGGGVEGYLTYDHRATVRRWGYDIVATEVVASSPAATGALWRLLGSSSTQAQTVEVVGPPEHPLLLVLPDQDLQPAGELRWMLRVVDLPGAVAARGYRPGVRVAVDLEVHDAWCPWNQGRWRLAVEGGEGRAEQGGDGDVQVGIGALSSLYSGYVSAGSLRAAGLLHGGSATDDASLDAAFAGQTPWMPDFY